jgi:hypothetical protein
LKMRPFVGDASSSAALRFRDFSGAPKRPARYPAVSYESGTDPLGLKLPPKTDVVSQPARIPMISYKNEDLGASAQR